MEHHAADAPSILSLFWPTVNFIIFVAILVRSLGGPLREFFRVRAERLREELATGDRARREAETLRAEVAEELADLPALRRRLRDDLRATAERERDEMLASARQAADRIREDARLLAAQELANARRALRNETVAAAIREATALVRAATQAEDQQRFVREFVAGAGAPS